MKRLFTLIFILFCFAEVKGQIIWERTEKDSITYRDEYMKVMVKDSLIFLNGRGNYTNSISSNKIFYDCYNVNGKLKWRKNGRNYKQYDVGADLIIDSDSMLLTYRFNQNTFKLDWQKIRMATGDTLRAARFAVPYSFSTIAGRYIIKEPNGSYIVGGDGPALSKINISGSPAWTKAINWYNPTTNTGFSGFTDFLRKNNGNYVMLGDINSVPNLYHGEHPILIEYKPNGDTLKSRTFVLEHPTFNEVTFYSKLTQTQDGGFLFTGRIDTVVDNCHGCDAKYFVAKTDTQFRLKWTYINKGILKGYNLLRGYELADSSYVILGGIYSPTQKNYAIFKVSKTGQYVSHQTFNASFCNGLPLLWDWKILPDGTSVVAGKCKTGYTYLARLASNGLPAVLGNSEEIEITNYTAEAFPNPTTGTVTFNYNLPAKARSAEIVVREIATGKEVKSIALNTLVKQTETSVASLKPGIYAYTLLVDGLPVCTKKLIVVK